MSNGSLCDPNQMTYKCWVKICLETKLMIRLTKIYTRTGDKGETSLGDGSRGF